MKLESALVLAALSVIAAAGCDGRKNAAAIGTASVKPADLDLEAAVTLVNDGQVKDGPALERAINSKSRVDVDGDRKRDPIQVVETRDGDGRVFHVRAIPSSKAKQRPDAVAVELATIEVDPDRGKQQVAIEAHYAPIVVGAETIRFHHVIPIVVDADVIVTTHPFLSWCLVIDRPIFIGVYYLTILEVDVHRVHYKGKHKKHK